MKVTELAKRNSLPADTIRHYTRIGLLTPARNATNGYKDYSDDDEKRLQFIIQAKSLGFSLSDIEAIVKQSATGRSPCPRVRELMTQRLKEFEQKIAAMQATYTKMQQAMESWQNLPDCTPTGQQVCHLIEKFNEVKNHG
jgi:DNA-binding transcriptional MerR regulator